MQLNTSNHCKLVMKAAVYILKFLFQRKIYKHCNQGSVSNPAY